MSESPSWQFAPTCVGLWLGSYRDGIGGLVRFSKEGLAEAQRRIIDEPSDYMYFGPIPERPVGGCIHHEKKESK